MTRPKPIDSPQGAPPRQPPDDPEDLPLPWISRLFLCREVREGLVANGGLLLAFRRRRDLLAGRSPMYRYQDFFLLCSLFLLSLLILCEIMKGTHHLVTQDVIENLIVPLATILLLPISLFVVLFLSGWHVAMKFRREKRLPLRMIHALSEPNVNEQLLADVFLTGDSSPVVLADSLVVEKHACHTVLYFLNAAAFWLVMTFGALVNLIGAEAGVFLHGIIVYQYILISFLAIFLFLIFGPPLLADPGHVAEHLFFQLEKEKSALRKFLFLFLAAFILLIGFAWGIGMFVTLFHIVDSYGTVWMGPPYYIGLTMATINWLVIIVMRIPRFQKQSRVNGHAAMEKTLNLWRSGEARPLKNG